MIRSFLDFENTLSILRSDCNGISLQELFVDDSLEPIRLSIENFVKDSKQCAPCLGYMLPSILCERITLPGIDNLKDSLSRYCERRFGDVIYTLPFLFELLFHLFPQPEIPLRIGRNVALESNGVILDHDGLMIDANQQMNFQREGIIVGSDWYLYDKSVPGAFVANSFIDDLVKQYNSCTEGTARLRVRINPDIIIPKDMHFDSFTKAYIRGPIGISASALNSPDFPPDPSGTVTEHKRVDTVPLSNLFPLDRIEVMWSCRDTIKSVQIEALMPEPTEYNEEVQTKYIHARWSPDESRIIHFDGATKTYDTENYRSRFATDIKKSISKSAKYEKSFRFDTYLELKDWCVLTTKYFDPNELILEYFGGVAE